MGSRAKRARLGIKAPLKPKTVPPASQPRGKIMPHVAGAPPPKLDDVTVVFSGIDHMPRYADVPDAFKSHNGNAYCKFMSDWFFTGRTPEDMARLTTKDGVDRADALRAIKAILGSWAPKHEHKEAACAWLLSEWFVLDATP